jgi:hypothetical protein
MAGVERYWLTGAGGQEIVYALGMGADELLV